MRGLNASVALAHLRVAQVIGLPVEEVDQLEIDAFNAATAQGVEDRRQGRTDLPKLFVGEPWLTAGWQDGQDVVAYMDELRECEHCREAHGDPCPYHG